MKVSKAQALYTYHPEVAYTCESCVFEKDANGKDFCAFFGPSVEISEANGSCGYYSHGHEGAPEVPWLSLFTPQELGYGENRNGFSCKRCVHFGVGKNDCNLVDRKSSGDTPGIISPNACCSLWELDPKRGSMSDKQLVQILAAKPKTGPRLSELAGLR